MEIEVTTKDIKNLHGVKYRNIGNVNPNLKVTKRVATTLVCVVETESALSNALFSHKKVHPQIIVTMNNAIVAFCFTQRPDQALLLQL